MDIDFHCGITARNVGEITLAVKSHLDTCLDETCKNECIEYLRAEGKF